jgi:putative hydrolase of the HAD superfamily
MALPRVADLRALLLDLDDTIPDDRSGLLPAWNVTVEFTCGECGGLSPEDLRAAISSVTNWFWSDPARERRGRLDLVEARCEIIGAALARLGIGDADLARRAAHVYTRRRDAGQRLVPGVGEALARLRGAFAHFALVTNGASLPQRAKLERFDLVDWFDHIQVEGEFGAGKPEPEVYRSVTRVLGVDPDVSLMVGDNFVCDVLGALDAGLHAAWIDVDGCGESPRPAPRSFATLSSLAELADRLGC